MPTPSKKYAQFENELFKPKAVFGLLNPTAQAEVLAALSGVCENALTRANEGVSGVRTQNQSKRQKSRTALQQAEQRPGTSAFEAHPLFEPNDSAPERLADWANTAIDEWVEQQPLENAQKTELKEELKHAYKLALRNAPKLGSLPRPTPGSGGGAKPENDKKYRTLPRLKPFL